MLLRYCFHLKNTESIFHENIAYPMYAALLEQIPEESADSIHGAQCAPISQYLYNNYWYVCISGNQNVEKIAPVLDKMTGIYLRCKNMTIEMECIKRQKVTTEMLLQTAVPSHLILSLRTPTAFKSGGCYQILPEQRFILQSMINKWNCCFNECPIEDTEDSAGLNAMAAGLVYKKINIHSYDFKLKGIEIPGTIGTLTIENRLEGFHRILANALLQFADYAGIGIKTALGMGGAAVLTADISIKTERH